MQPDIVLDMTELLPMTGHRPVLLRSELMDMGVTDQQVRRAVRSNELMRPARGAVCAPVNVGERHDIELNRYLRRVLAHALRAPSYVVSHLSAGAWHGLPTSGASLQNVQVTLPQRTGGKRSAGLWRHAGELTGSDVTTVNGIRVTSVARTVVDVARTESLRRGVAIVDAALRERKIAGADVVEVLERCAHGRGIAKARKAVALADGRSESVGESFTRVALCTSGLPKPDLQINVCSASGEFLGRCDLGYAEHAVLIEFDGKVKYTAMARPGESAADVVVREKRREDALRAAGFIVVRFAWGDLARPEQITATVKHALDLGRAAVAAGIVSGRAVPPPAITVPIP